MKRTRGKRLGIPAVAVGLLSVAGLAWAQTPTSSAQSQVTREQSRQLDELRSQYEEKTLTLEKRLSAAELELDRALARPDMDSDQFIALRGQVRNLEGQLEDQYLRANAEAGKLMGIAPGATINGADPLGYGWAPAWHDSCGWSGCPWGGAWHDGRRATAWHRFGARTDSRGARMECGCGGCW
ncbi:MAG: hypothetical protein F9K18_01055 [Thermoanaerobaculia bacterium]|nr:MAG: hypothetical protein F9K18_01055 [Thermoanaerobaculia bacterium]